MVHRLAPALVGAVTASLYTMIWRILEEGYTRIRSDETHEHVGYSVVILQSGLVVRIC